jgi:hypothetical protein
VLVDTKQFMTTDEWQVGAGQGPLSQRPPYRFECHKRHAARSHAGDLATRTRKLGVADRAIAGSLYGGVATPQRPDEGPNANSVQCS